MRYFQYTNGNNNYPIVSFKFRPQQHKNSHHLMSSILQFNHFLRFRLRIRGVRGFTPSTLFLSQFSAVPRPDM